MAEGGSSATVIPLRDAQPGGGAARHSPDLVAFLFTDIEGSTRLWETQPAAVRAALAKATGKPEVAAQLEAEMRAAGGPERSNNKSVV